MRIAIIDDEPADFEALKRNLSKYAFENGGIDFQIEYFQNAVVFLNNYKAVYDLVFMDIQMPHMDGMEAAKKLREHDPDAILIFITNMANYAVQGYSVNAADFIIKPIGFYGFKATMDKVLRIYQYRDEATLLKTAYGVKKVPILSIYYIEVQRHRVIYHTNGGDIETWGSLKEQEPALPKGGFARCNNYCLVNLKYVLELKKDYITVGGTELFISRAKKKEFMRALLSYYGKNA